MLVNYVNHLIDYANYLVPQRKALTNSGLMISETLCTELPENVQEIA